MAEEPKKRTALHCALDLLARREHFCSELLNKLRLRGFDESEIAAALESAIEQGWQSEERACESYVRSRMQKGFGRLKILAELQQRQVSDQLINHWLPRDESIWLDAISLVGAKKFNLIPGEKLDAKQLRFFLSRGFPTQLIYSVFS